MRLHKALLTPALIFLAITLTAAPAHADLWNIGFELGLRYFGHFNGERTYGTPPSSLSLEAQPSVTLLNWFTAYLVVTPRTFKGSASMTGGGLRVNFLDFKGGYVLSKLDFFVLADYVHYSTDPPIAPYTYSSSAGISRFGGGAHWELLHTPLYVDTTFMISHLKYNWFIAPMLGVGLVF